jgi:hypothetical protein
MKVGKSKNTKSLWCLYSIMSVHCMVSASMVSVIMVLVVCQDDRMEYCVSVSG